jgi:ABC-type Na+ efflux pump permease subunit
MVTYLFYLPFTSPMVALVKLSQGFGAGQTYTLFLSLLILLISTIIAVQIAARIYKMPLRVAPVCYALRMPVARL